MCSVFPVFLRLPRYVRLAVLVALSAGRSLEASAAPSRWPTTVDLDPDETVTSVRDGVSHTFRILDDEDGQPAIAYETMPFPTTSVDKRVNYAVRVRLKVDEQEVEVVARPFQYPIVAAGLRLYLDGTKEWLGTDDVYPVNIPKRLRLRFTAAGELWGPATVRFPIGEYRWCATTYYNTWLGVVPQGVETTYYHKGEDFGAVPDLLPVLAPEAGAITTNGTGVQTRSADGTFFWMAHMNAANIVVSAGEQAVAGQLLGLTGNRGNGNADPHCHYDLSWDGDEPGTFPFAADAYLRDYPDAGIPVAGGYQFMWAGDTLALDGRRSLARPGRTITGYRWILHDGTVVDGPTAALTPAEPGFFSQELRVFFDDGSEERGFTQVRAFERGAAGQLPISGFVYQHPVRGITPGSEVTIRHHAFVIGSYGRTIDFGDGSPVETVAGWQPVVSHRYAAPGLYTVTVRPAGDFAQILKTSVLVEGGGSGPNRPPVIAGPEARDWRCFAGRELVVSLSGFDPDGDPLDWSIARARLTWHCDHRPRWRGAVRTDGGLRW
ncbi:MAG: peptidoglycan DD-metalloendopeptidase family protein [Opitutaceae bacterium]|nr:peptidoglycan DD-metalloendopeptidase family protein [Opitutaceae bacterium]